MRLRRRRVHRRRTTTVLLLGTLYVLAGCQGGSDVGDGSPEGVRDESLRELQVPPSLGEAKRCTAVAKGVRSATSGGVVAGPFDNLATAARNTGVAKLWVAASEDQSRTEEDAVIRVEVAEGPVQGDPALYVRPFEDMVTVSPAPENGVERIYNGTVFVPSAVGTTLRITVTIGDATGCFLTRM